MRNPVGRSMAALKKLEQQNNRLKSSYHTASEKREMKAAREKRQATRAEASAEELQEMLDADMRWLASLGPRLSQKRSDT